MPLPLTVTLNPCPIDLSTGETTCPMIPFYTTDSGRKLSNRDVGIPLAQCEDGGCVDGKGTAAAIWVTLFERMHRASKDPLPVDGLNQLLVQSPKPETMSPLSFTFDLDVPVGELVKDLAIVCRKQWFGGKKVDTRMYRETKLRRMWFDTPKGVWRLEYSTVV